MRFITLATINCATDGAGLQIVNEPPTRFTPQEMRSDVASQGALYELVAHATHACGDPNALRMRRRINCSQSQRIKLGCVSSPQNPNALASDAFPMVAVTMGANHLASKSH